MSKLRKSSAESLKHVESKLPATTSATQEESLDNQDWNLVEKMRFKEELNAAEIRYNADRARLEARLEREVQKVAKSTASMTKVQSPLDSAPVLWAVAKGRTLDSRGVYPSWEVCHPRVHGVHNSVFDEFNTEHDAWQYSLKGQAGGPDTSIGQKGKVFGINIHNLKALEDLCVRPPLKQCQSKLRNNSASRCWTCHLSLARSQCRSPKMRRHRLRWRGSLPPLLEKSRI
jgi:hypothetical protein